MKYLGGGGGYGFPDLMFMTTLEAPEYAPDSEPKLSLSWSMSCDLLPRFASVSHLFCKGVFLTSAYAAGLLVVLSGTLAGLGSAKDNRVGAPFCMGTGWNGILLKDSPIASDVSAVC
jgi:hypothetical protein